MARRQDDGSWSIPIHGRLYNTERRKRKKKAFWAVLGKSFQIAEQDRDIFHQRTNPFLVDNLRWRRVQVRVGNKKKVFRLPRTSKNGHFQDEVRVPKIDHVAARNGLITVQVVLGSNDPRKFQTQVQLLPSLGVSVISDIDDTIKISNVTEKTTLLRNTFLKEFQAVPGMAKLYQMWKTRYGCSFHFVSSSPWQLYEELETFRQQQGFPFATYHLKSVRVKDKTLFNLFADPVKTKTETISSMLRNYPRRKFICVGDSGEKDPEVYGALARKYPDQIRHVLIRNVTVTDDVARMEMAFKAVPRRKWGVFTDVSEIRLPARL